MHPEPMRQRRVVLFFMFDVLEQVLFQFFFKFFMYFRKIAWIFNIKAIFLSYSFFLVIFETVSFFILKFISSIRLEIDSNSRSYVPLKVSYERFLYNSVIACSSIERWSPKDIPSAERNWMETNPWEFVSLKIS